MTSLLTLTAADATVELAPDVGGAIAAFRHDGVDVMRATSPVARAARDVRGFACYPLVPYSNRIANARLDFDGDRYRLARNLGDHPHCIHGVGWQRAWRVVANDRTSALLHLAHAPQGDDAAAWPFAFEAWQSFSLAQSTSQAMLTMTLSIASRDVRAFPAGLGWHPFFPRDDATELGFAADAIWDTDATRLPTKRRAVDPSISFATPRSIGDTRLDNVFAGWSGDAAIRWPQARRQATIEADRSLAFLVVFVPDDRDWLAVEPVTHMTDAFNRFAAGERDTGTIVLAPGGVRSCTMRVVSSPLA